MAFTAQKMAEVTALATRARSQLARVRETAEESIGDTLQVVETGASAFALAYANMRWGEDGELRIVGIPADLGVATALTGLAMMGGLGKYKEHGVNFGAGAIAIYAGRMGAEMGAKAANEAGDASYQRTLAGKKSAGGLGTGNAGGVGAAGQQYVVNEK